jgi:hypothetical protein
MIALFSSGGVWNVSKNHRENRKPAYADWVVRDTGGATTLLTAVTFSRDHRGGCTFTAADGVKADFPPGAVLAVTRRPLRPASGLSPEPETLDSRA